MTRATTSLVTGANRGLGFEVSRQLGRLGHRVLMGIRDPAKGERAVAELRAEGLDVHLLVLDMGSATSIEQAAAELDTLDVLVNNAAVHYDTWQSPSRADWDIVDEAWRTNSLGPWRLSAALAPLLRRSPHGRIVNVSSGGGSLSSMGGGTPAYSVTKAALNAVTRLFADELARDGVLVNAVCPGWVATDMGGGGRPIPDGAAGIVWAATLPDDGPTGGFFRDARPIAW